MIQSNLRLVFAKKLRSSKDINFPISKEYADEKNKNEKAENVATHFNSSRQYKNMKKKRILAD